jgi:peptidoglycan hydrolase-like protein with peptidoglycan-binding domain
MRRTLALSATLFALVATSSAHAAPAMRIHLASGIKDGSRTWVMKGQRVIIQGTRSFADDGYATAGIFFKNKEIATTRSPLHGKVGGLNGVYLHFTAKRIGTYKAVVKVFKTADPTTPVTTVSFGVHTIKPKASFGSHNRSVRLLQEGLRALAYVTPVNGSYEDSTGRAVLAFRKVNGMARVETPSTAIFKKLFRGQGGFRLKYPKAGRHLEFDWSRQVLVFAQGGKPVRIYHASSGKPSTPTVFGTFHFYSKTPGTNSEGMVDSNYFIRGYAVHGYASVPPYAASHGCIRVPIPDAASIYADISIGETIFVYV